MTQYDIIPQKSSKIAIITGVNGQLGQYFVNYLLANEPHVRIIGTIRHKSYDNQPLAFDRSRITMEIMDLADQSSIESIIVKHKPDYFINTAASAFVAESWQMPNQYYEFNCLAVVHQLEAIRKHSPRTRYINLGTSEEFGDVVFTPQDESHPIRPRSPYGATKAAARFAVKVWRESYGLYALQNWTFNFESPLRGEKYVTRKITLGVARIAKSIKDGVDFAPLELGNLGAKRAWQYAGDVADGLWRSLNQELYRRDKNGDEAIKDLHEYVFSEDNTHTVREFVEEAFKGVGLNGVWAGSGVDEVYVVAGKKVVVINSSYYRPAEVSLLFGDSTKARLELGWRRTVDFKALVSMMVKSDVKQLG